MSTTTKPRATRAGRPASGRGGLRIGPIRLGRQAPVHPIRHHVDVFNPQLIYGWAVHESSIRAVRVYRGETPLGEARIGLDRPDVRAAFPEVAGSGQSGFLFSLTGHLADGTHAIVLEIEAGDGTRTRSSRDLIQLDLDGPGAPHAFRPGVDRATRSGFPFEVTGLLRAFRPGAYDDDSAWDDERMARAVEDLGAVWHNAARAPALSRYVLFLKTMLHRFRWVAARFPKDNQRVAPDAKDSMGRATTPEEMLAIAHQLLVLKSQGIDGRFLEFGCFKGFSSSCLSYGCRHLDLPMEIFDSFAGLPPSDSTYYAAGEFCGTFDEVSSNIEEFGDPRPVRYHKGFFADTLPHFNPGPVIAIWMDVDLYSSARDVAQVFDAMPRASVVFTHEFPPDGAENGRVLPEKSEVFPPILDRFESLGWTPVGRHLAGNTGAIWDASEGIPVLPQPLLMRLAGLGE